MNAKKYEYQSDFAKHFYGQGVAQGRAWARVDFVLELLTTRYGALHSAVADRLLNTSNVELHDIAKRVLTAETLEEALGLRLTTT